MKPIPASWMQRSTPSGESPILTPRAASVSAAPEREDAARLPCLATVTPQAAVMIAASVDTLREPEPSPPVPTMSIASGGALTLSILARMAATAPVSSSTVSPRTLKAMRNPPICEGVTSPESMESKALSASLRVSVAPAATLAIRGLKDSISSFRVLVRRFAGADERRPRGRGNYLGSAGHARWRCFRDGTARRMSGAPGAERP